MTINIIYDYLFITFIYLFIIFIYHFITFIIFFLKIDYFLNYLKIYQLIYYAFLSRIYKHYRER